MHVCTYIHTYTHTYIHTYIYVYLCIYIYMRNYADFSLCATAGTLTPGHGLEIDIQTTA